MAPGDRTLIDSLQPALLQLRKTVDESRNLDSALESAAQAADLGAAATVSMKASAGRASYVNASELKFPDPGVNVIKLFCP